MIMKKYVSVLLMVCLIAGSAFATNSWTASTGSWGTASGWNSSTLGAGVLPGDTEQVKILGGTTCTLDVTAVTFAVNKVTVATSTTQSNLNIVDGGTLTSAIEIQVGDASGKIGKITQSGGTINLNGTSLKDSKLEVGYKGGPGYYTISGGSIATNGYSQLLVGPSGSVNGGNGTFTVQGTGGSINVQKLFVGVQDSSGTFTGTGTLAFEINGGVSAINTGSVYIDPTNLVAAVANLSVTKTGSLPDGNIILINNTDINEVIGAFDNAAWGSTITLGGVAYTLTNTYIGGLDGIGNDVALLLPAMTAAQDPSPADGATDVALTPTLIWTAGDNAISHDVYFGTDNPPSFVQNQTETTYNPGTLASDTTYYWAIDENNAGIIVTGDVWSFTTIFVPGPGKASDPSPADGAVINNLAPTLSWTAGVNAASHDVYFGTESPGTFQGNQAGTTFNPGTLVNGPTYYWRIDEKNDNGTTSGDVWSFSIRTPGLTIRKCTVKAGKTQYAGDSDFNDMKDSFTASGTLASLPGDLNTIDHIDVNIISADGNSIFFEANDFNYMRNVKKNVFTHKYKITKGNPTGGAITSMKIDFIKKTFAITIKNADLTGLACPLELDFGMGDNIIWGDANEAIVNGNKKSIPTRLMRLYQDTLVVTRAKAKRDSLPGYDSISVKGDIAVADMNLDANEPNLCNEEVILTWGDVNDTSTQTFTIPAGSFKVSRKGHVYKCNRINSDIVNAAIDLDKCTFTVSIKNANGIFADKLGDAVFGINFATQEGVFDEEDDYILP